MNYLMTSIEYAMALKVPDTAARVPESADKVPDTMERMPDYRNKSLLIVFNANGTDFCVKLNINETEKYIRRTDL